MNSPCLRCQMCCQSNTKPSQPAVFLTEKETISFGFATITYEKKDGVYKCRFLEKDGCSLGDSRPAMCKIYPLVVEKDKGFSVSNRCPHNNYFNTSDKHEMIHTLTIVDRNNLNKIKGREKGVF